MSGAINPLPQYAFMAWCLVKAQGQLYLFIYANYGTTVWVCVPNKEAKLNVINLKNSSGPTTWGLGEGLTNNSSP
jgi:hypothetical protein